MDQLPDRQEGHCFPPFTPMPATPRYQLWKSWSLQATVWPLDSSKMALSLHNDRWLNGWCSGAARTIGLLRWRWTLGDIPQPAPLTISNSRVNRGNPQVSGIYLFPKPDINSILQMAQQRIYNAFCGNWGSVICHWSCWASSTPQSLNLCCMQPSRSGLEQPQNRIGPDSSKQ